MTPRDPVEEAGLESFPASDPPAWGNSTDRRASVSRLHTRPVADATGALADMFAAIRKSIGKVPNAYATIGSNSPAVLAQVLRTASMLQNESLLDRRELEAINLAVSESSACHYCLSAHTLSGKAAGFSLEQTRDLRGGTLPDDPKIDALTRFARVLVETSDTLPAASLEAVRRAGYTDRQIVEAIYAVAAILFTNMLNRVNDTTLDFPPVDALA